MTGLIELTTEEKGNINGGYFFGPLIIDVVGFYNSIKDGFSKGLTDALQK